MYTKYSNVCVYAYQVHNDKAFCIKTAIKR